VIRTDRQLLADLARLNSDVVPLAMRIIDDTATSEEQHVFADRLIDLGGRFHQRAQAGMIVEADQEL
jgi:hypothetical protein